jgi:hypothetical protein
MILTDKLVYIEQEKLDLAHTQSPAGRHLSFDVSDFEAWLKGQGSSNLAHTQSPAGRWLIFDASDFETWLKGQGSSAPMNQPQFDQMSR